MVGMLRKCEIGNDCRNYTADSSDLFPICVFAALKASYNLFPFVDRPFRHFLFVHNRIEYDVIYRFSPSGRSCHDEKVRNGIFLSVTMESIRTLGVLNK